jgi:hypothetical protein
MKKQFLAFGAALAAVGALAVIPAAASASPELVQGSTRVATGAALSAVNSGNVYLLGSDPSGNGTITCSEGKFSGTLKTNSGSLIEGSLEGGSLGFNSTCSEGGTGMSWKVTLDNMPWCLKSSSLGSWEANGGGCGGTKPVGFTLSANVFVGTAVCSYTRSALSLTSGIGTEPLRLHTASGQLFSLSSSNGYKGCRTGYTLSGEYTLKANGLNVKVQ